MTQEPGALDSNPRFRLDEWTVTPLEGTLVGAAGRRRLQPRQMDVLMALVRRPGQVVTREALLREVWGGRAMSDEPLTRCIAELRVQLGDQRGVPRYIQTIPKRGYRLVAPVEWEDSADASAGAETRPIAEVAPILATDAAATTDAIAGAEPVEAPEVASAPDATAAAPGSVFERRLRIAAIVALLLLAVAGAWWANRTPPASVRHAVAKTTVAVLPFSDLSPAADQQYFADGVHEEIIARLAANPTLDVISRTSVMPYRDSRESLREIAAALGAGAVIEGSVRHADGRVRVTAQLIDARTDKHLWADSFDRELTLQNLFAIQGEVAERVASGLQANFDAGASPAAARIPTKNLEAYDEFLLGKYYYRRLQPADLRQSVRHLQRAVELDPAFADAWDWLAYAWNHSATEQGWTTPRDAYPRARAAAVRALELDPQLASSRALLGYLRAVYDWDWAGAVVELEQAMKHAPEDTGTVWSYAYVLSLTGEHDRAIELTRALAHAAPKVGRNELEVAYRLNEAGRYEEAAASAERARSLGAEAGLSYDVLGTARLGMEQIDAAIAAFEQAVTLQRRAPDVLGHLASAFARGGREEEARAILTELQALGQGTYVSPMVYAEIHAALGEDDAAFAMLEQASSERVRRFLSVGASPMFSSLRDDPRLATLLAQTGLPVSHARP